MVIPNEQKLRKFSGRHGDNELSIEDFIDNAKSAITSRGLPFPEQANFILSYLEGPAKEEMKLYPKSDLKNSDKIFDLLQESFAGKRSVPQLLKAFYDRRQREGETLRAFSQTLRELQAKIEKKSVTKSSGQDAALRDHFAENVRDIPSFERNLRNLSEHTRKFPFQTPERKLFAGLKKTRSPVDHAKGWLRRMRPVPPLSPLPSNQP